MHVVLPEQSLSAGERGDCVQSSARSCDRRVRAVSVFEFELEFGSDAAGQQFASHGEVQRLCLEWGRELTHSRVKGQMRGVFPASCSQWNVLLASLEAISVSD